MHATCVGCKRTTMHVTRRLLDSCGSDRAACSATCGRVQRRDAGQQQVVQERRTECGSPGGPVSSTLGAVLGVCGHHPRPCSALGAVHAVLLQQRVVLHRQGRQHSQEVVRVGVLAKVLGIPASAHPWRVSVPEVAVGSLGQQHTTGSTLPSNCQSNVEWMDQHARCEQVP
jgi:hypothetical protein